MSKKKKKKKNTVRPASPKPNTANKNAPGKKAAISIEASDRAGSKIDVSIKPQKRKLSEKDKDDRREIAINAIALVNMLVIGAMLVGGFVYMVFLKHETKADDENRMLAKFPKFSVESYLSGEYTEGVAHYFDDTVHNRSAIKKFIANRLMPLKGRKFGDDGAELYGSGFEQKAETTAPVTTTLRTTTFAAKTSTSTETTTTTAPPEPENPPAEGELTNNILIVNGRGINLYGGGWGGELTYAAYVNEYKEKLKDVNVYSMVLPTAGAFYLPENYKDLAYSEKEDFDRIDEALADVVSVDAYTALLRHKDEAIYSRTDHHWQPLGAYYAAEEFCSTAGVPFAPLSDYETVSLPGYVGTLYMYTKSDTLLNNPEDFVYYIPKTGVSVTQYDTRKQNAVGANLLLDPGPMATSSYYMVFGSDERIVHVNTECKNGRTLVIFKDSYGNALLPVLTSSFENIWLCDVRYFDLNAAQFIKETGATDVLFAMCSFSAVGGNKNGIHENLVK